MVTCDCKDKTAWCSPSQVMVTSPNERQILEWDENEIVFF